MHKKFWEDRLPDNRLTNGHLKANCPICKELKQHFYANIQTGCWDCKICKESGNIITYLQTYEKRSNFEIRKILEDYEINEQKIDPIVRNDKVFQLSQIERYCKNLSEDQLRRISEDRGLSEKILIEHKIGVDEQGFYTVPIYDEKGMIRNIQRKLIGGDTISIKGGRAFLFGVEDLVKNEPIIVAEGVWSSMALKEKGFNSVGTLGSGVLLDDQIPLFKDKDVYIVPDLDEAGRKGAEKIEKKVKNVAKSVKIIDLTGKVSEKQDIRDFFNNGGTKEAFESLIKNLPEKFTAPISIKKFLAQDIRPVEYYVTDIIQKEGRTMISADTNKGKSIFAQNLALAMTSGLKVFLERFEVSEANVLYLDLEMGESAMHQRFKTMLNQYEDIPVNLYVNTLFGFDLLEEESQSHLEKWISDKDINVLILDPIGSGWIGDENNKQEVSKLTSYLDTLIGKFGISIVVIHHWRKATKDVKSGGAMAAGSYKWSAWLDNHITLDGNPTSLTLTSEKSRNQERFSPIILGLDSENLSFKFLADFEKKFTDNTLAELFDEFKSESVSLVDIIKLAEEKGSPSANTIRKLVKESSLFESFKVGKKKFIRRKQENTAIFGENGLLTCSQQLTKSGDW